MTTNINNLSAELKENIYKQGYFFMSNRRQSEYWIDLYSLSHFFNASKNSKTYRSLLKDLVKDVVLHQKNNMGVNAVIVPRWLRNTEDLFTETLLNICFELSTELPEFSELAIYELFSAGGDDQNDYYLNFVETVNENKEPSEIKAIALLALDIHSWVFDFLLDNVAYSNIKITSVISVIGRCGQFPTTQTRRNADKASKFKIFPFFDASIYDGINEQPEFNFIAKNDTKIYAMLFASEDSYAEKYIPVEKWSHLV